MHGRVDGRERRGRHPHGEGSRPGAHDRDHSLRLWYALSKQDVQPGIPEGEGTADAALAFGIEDAGHGAVSTMSNPLVSTAWLAEHIEAPDIRIADASWYLP